MSRPHTPQQPAFTRSALVPGLLGSIALLVGLALVAGGWYQYVLYVVSILALILCVFAGQAKKWWWLSGLVPIAILWNPVWPITGLTSVLPLLTLPAAIVFTVAGIMIKTPNDTRR